MGVDSDREYKDVSQGKDRKFTNAQMTTATRPQQRNIVPTDYNVNFPQNES